MMMLGDRKKAVSIIISSMQPSYVSKDGGEMEGEYKTPDSEAESAQIECAEAFISCVKSGDAKGLVEALKDLLTLCEGGESSGGDLYETMEA